MPGYGQPFADSVRLSLNIVPEFDADHILFDLAYGSDEFGLKTDRVGIFVNARYTGLLAQHPIDQHHPWINKAGSGLGLQWMLYPDADPNQYPSFTVAIAVPSPGEAFTLDFVLADAKDGSYDTALFLGNLRGSREPAGYQLVPEPGTLALLMIGGSLAAIGLRRPR